MTQIDKRMIDFPSNGGTTPGFLAEPGEGGSYPGLVVIQEWWGLVPHIKQVAQRFAEAGFVALAPDLYHGQAAGEPDEARKLAMEMDRERAVAEILAAADYVHEHSSGKVGVVGWCMGGGLVYAAAAERDSGLLAGVAFYGAPSQPETLAQVKIPLLGLYGEQDRGIPPERARAIDAELSKHNVPHEIHIYPGAPHAFFNDTRPQAYRAEAAEDAWQRTLAWFRRHLG